MINSRKICSVFALCAGISLAGVLCVPVRAGDRLDEFKEAARGSGCNLIPYSSLRSDCFEENKPKKEYCRPPKNAGCSSLNKENEEDRNVAKERKDNAIACITARGRVREVYVKAVDMLTYDAGHDDIPEVKSLANDIISKINDAEEIRGHEIALQQDKNRRDKCEAVENNRE